MTCNTCIKGKVVLGRKGEPRFDWRPPKAGISSTVKAHDTLISTRGRANLTTVDDRNANVQTKSSARFRASPDYGGSLIPHDLPMKKSNPAFNVRPLQTEPKETLILA